MPPRSFRAKLSLPKWSITSTTISQAHMGPGVLDLTDSDNEPEPEDYFVGANYASSTPTSRQMYPNSHSGDEVFQDDEDLAERGGVGGRYRWKETWRMRFRRVVMELLRLCWYGFLVGYSVVLGGMAVYQGRYYCLQTSWFINGVLSWILVLAELIWTYRQNHKSIWSFEIADIALVFCSGILLVPVYKWPCGEDGVWAEEGLFAVLMILRNFRKLMAPPSRIRMVDIDDSPVVAPSEKSPERKE